MIDWFLILTSLAKTIGIIFLVVLPMVSYTVYAERRVSAAIQDRVGPNRTGIPFTNIRIAGLGQPIADAIKFLLKEDFTPGHVNKFYYWLAPALAMIPSLLALVVTPFGSTLFGVPMVIADVNVGVLFVFAITSLTVYGIVIAGWASNSKYPFLGGVRSSAQMISYELSLGLSVIPLFLVFSTLNLSEIVLWQQENGWILLPIWLNEWSWSPAEWPRIFSESWDLQRFLLWIPLSLSAVVFMISLFAETNRAPFDLPESETELVAGYHTEYSSMKFALFFLGEYCAMIAGAAVFVTLFLGGWTLPFMPDGTATTIFGWTPDADLSWLSGLFWGLVNITVFFGKVALLLFVFIWVRWTLPRFRYDQLMKLGWVVFFEVALFNIILTAIILAYFPLSS
ncbi:MAG: NADH-quinone oxidoreductase subunit H [Verrucomicrobiales bacterium]